MTQPIPGKQQPTRHGFLPRTASLSWRFLEKPLIRRAHGYSYGESAIESKPQVCEAPE